MDKQEAIIMGARVKTELVQQEDTVFSPDVSIVVPACNEEPAIREALSRLVEVMDDQPQSYEIIVVDDGSSDGTANAVGEVSGVRLLRHEGNRGYGAALKSGIRKARAEIIVITDADGTYPSEHIPELLEALQDRDMAVGARTGEHVKVPLLRKPAKWLLNKLAGHLAQQNIPDLNSGLRAFRKGDVVPLFGILPSGFSFTTTITLAMLCNDMRVKYIPIEYHKREGHSKIRPLPDTTKFILLVLRTICLFNPLRVFLPLAALLLALGLIRLGWNVVISQNIAELETMLILGGIQVGAFGLLADMVARLRRLPGSNSDNERAV